MRFWPRGLAIGGRHRRGFVAALLVVNQFAVASGLPLPVSAAMNAAVKKDLSKPFPCMNRACGCLNADQCWHSCCCFTMREKLAWAAENGVEPPEFVREAAAREALADASNAGHEPEGCCEERHCCCCSEAHESHNGRQVCQVSGGQDFDRQICGTHGSIPAALTAPAKPSNAPARQPAGKSVILLMALGCQGQNLFSLLAQALPFVRRPMVRYEALPIGTVSLRTGSFTSYREPPVVPPPERQIAARLICSVIELG